MRAYTDDQLIEAVRSSRSWRGVLRALGIPGHSAGPLRSARKRADALGLDTRHFTGQRRWNDAQLADAVPRARSWTHLAELLALRSASAETLSTLRGHALRIGIETAHLEPRQVPSPVDAPLTPCLEHLPRAAPLMAAAWFELAGAHVSWPLEPTRYDLIAWMRGGPQRIQVKTTRQPTSTSWRVRLATSRKAVHTYQPEEIDQFFIIDGDLGYYLIPIVVVAGFKEVTLSAYAAYRLPRTH